MILDEIAAKTKERIAQRKIEIPLEELKQKAYAMPKHRDEAHPYPFENALKREGLSLICEVKKASPSKGVIAQEFPYVEIAQEYERVGADCISVLTEPFYFQGSDAFLKEIREKVKLPIIRKDFTVDEYMIYEAKLMGADAVLLICAILSQDELERYYKIADDLGLTALIETHSAEEIDMAMAAKARVIGVNNRNLKDFTVDIHNSVNLRKLVPDSVVFVSESGMKTVEDMKVLKENHTDAVLIGETLMRSNAKEELVKSFKEC